MTSTGAERGRNFISAVEILCVVLFARADVVRLSVGGQACGHTRALPSRRPFWGVCAKRLMRYDNDVILCMWFYYSSHNMPIHF